MTSNFSALLKILDSQRFTRGVEACPQCREDFGRRNISRTAVSAQIRSLTIAGALVVLFLALGASQVCSEIVQVKYRGQVDLKTFDCTEVSRSSFIKRVCYDPRNNYMLINLNGTYYHYCEIDGATVSSLLTSDSMGRFYNASIKGQFDCRTRPVPDY
jgi:hypothetical protein